MRDKNTLLTVMTLEKDNKSVFVNPLMSMASGPFTSWQIDGEIVETVADFLLRGSKSLQMVIAAMKLKDACSLEEKL